MEHELSRVSCCEVICLYLMSFCVVVSRSLKVIGNPHDIASLIKTQRDEIRLLEEQLQDERANKQRDMSHAMRSMDCQLHASRNGALNERHKLGIEHETLRAEMELRLANELREHDRNTTELHEFYSAELSAKTAHYEVVVGYFST